MKSLTIVLSQEIFSSLRETMPWTGKEAKLFLLCHASTTKEISKLYAYKIMAPEENEYESRTAASVTVPGKYLSRVYQTCLDEQAHMIWVHNHPPGVRGKFSQIDVREENSLFRHVHSKIDGLIQASIVFSHDHAEMDAWWYDQNKDQAVPVDKINVVGPTRFQTFIPTGREQDNFFCGSSPALARSIEAYGEESMRQLSLMNVAVVGASGTGGHVIEMLARDGVRQITICDPDVIEESNLNRLLGATRNDIGKNKARFYARRVRSIQPGTSVKALPVDVFSEKAQRELAMADIIFGCVDSAARFALNMIAVANLIPYFDLGAGVTKDNGKLAFVGGQVSCILPGGSCCLDCMRLFDSLKAELCSPKELIRRREMGYVANVRAPLVMPLDAVIAGYAVNAMHEYVWGLGTNHPSVIEIGLYPRKVRPLSMCSEKCWICKEGGFAGVGNRAPLIKPQEELDISKLPRIVHEAE